MASNSGQTGLKPNGFFSSGKQVSEFIAALQGRHEIPLKSEYLDKGAEYWNRIALSPEYAISAIEADLIEGGVPSIFREVGTKRINLVDLGCGTGEKIFPIIS
jgi:uncharacterized SAM-dependent methyltransferase